MVEGQPSVYTHHHHYYYIIIIICIYIFFFFFGEGWECKRTQERLTKAKNKKRVTEVLQTKDCYKQKFTSIKISFDLYYMRY